MSVKGKVDTEPPRRTSKGSTAHSAIPPSRRQLPDRHIDLFESTADREKALKLLSDQTCFSTNFHCCQETVMSPCFGLQHWTDEYGIHDNMGFWNVDTKNNFGLMLWFHTEMEILLISLFIIRKKTCIICSVALRYSDIISEKLHIRDLSVYQGGRYKM